MSDPDLRKREWRLYLDDMIEFAQKVYTYTDGLDKARFIAAELTYDATLRNLELTGEAATHIPEEIRSAYPDIPWRLIIATRDRLIDDDTIWSIIRDDIPALLPALRKLKDRESQ